MPVLDLAGWPENRGVKALYILWARMTFPHDPALRKQFVAVRLADLKTDPKLFPENSRLTEGVHGEIMSLLCDIGCNSLPSESEDSLKNQFLEKGGVKTLKDAPSDSEILKKFVSSFYKGRVAGEILFLLKQMDDANIGRQGSSVNKAVHIIETLRSEFYREMGQPANVRYFQESFQEYKSVAHLWATYCLSKESTAYPEQHDPRSEQSLIGFLNIAENFRRFATTFTPHGQRKPIILEDETLSPPEFLPPLPLDIPLPPLSEEQLAAINSYRAPISPN
jgi:hypothetical protein